MTGLRSHFAMTQEGHQTAASKGEHKAIHVDVVRLATDAMMFLPRHFLLLRLVWYKAHLNVSAKPQCMSFIEQKFEFQKGSKSSTSSLPSREIVVQHYLHSFIFSNPVKLALLDPSNRRDQNHYMNPSRPPRRC